MTFGSMDRKWWFALSPDSGSGDGGDDEGGKSPDDEGDKKDDDTSFLDIDDKKGDDKKVDDGLGTGLVTPSKKKIVDPKVDDASIGQRPSNIPEKFWDVEKKEVRLDTLVDSYAEAESALTRLRGENKVPEFVEGYLDVFTFDTENMLRYSEGVDRLPAIPKDDPLFQGALESFHKRGLSTEQAIGVIKDVFEVMDGLYPEPFDNDAYKAEQQTLLGANHEMQVETAKSYIQSLHTQGILNLGEAKALHGGVLHSASGVMAMNKIRAEITGEAVMPVHDPVPEDGIPTAQELYSMKLSDEYKTDSAFKKKVDDLFVVVFPGTGGNVDLTKLGGPAISAYDAQKRQKTN